MLTLSAPFAGPRSVPQRVPEVAATLEAAALALRCVVHVMYPGAHRQGAAGRGVLALDPTLTAPSDECATGKQKVDGCGWLFE